MSDIFVAIADPKRRQILEALAKQEQTAADLAKTIKETPAATNKHLAILKEAGLVKASRAKVAVYSSNPRGLKPLGVWVAKFAGAEITAELGVRAEELAEIAGDYINQGSTWLGKKLNPKSKVKNLDDLLTELGRAAAEVKKTAEDEVTDKVQTAAKELKVKVRVKRK
jgi:DNA-binding transcriptional ArsR family regulator